VLEMRRVQTRLPLLAATELERALDFMHSERAKGAHPEFHGGIVAAADGAAGSLRMRG
jgi:hypothetical protein